MTDYAIRISAAYKDSTSATLAQTASNDVDDGGQADWNLWQNSFRQDAFAGAGAAWEWLDNALQVRINARKGSAAAGLHVHDAEVYEAHGAVLDCKVTLDPAPESGETVTVQYKTQDSSSGMLAPARGATGGGTERLWSHRDARGLAPDAEPETGSRLEAELGYGFSVLADRGVATPWAGLSRSQTGGTLRLGQRLKLGRASEWRVEGAFGEGGRTYAAGYGYRLGQSLDLTLEASRREAANDNEPAHGVVLRTKMRW